MSLNKRSSAPVILMLKVIFPYLVEVILNIFFNLVKKDVGCKRALVNTGNLFSIFCGVVIIVPKFLTIQFRQLNLNIDDCSVLIRPDKVIFVDTKRKIVFRFSTSQSGVKNIENNYSSLKNMMLDCAPSPLFFHEIGGAVLSAESFLSGSEVNIHEIKDEKVSDIFKKITPAYEENLSVGVFNLREELDYYDKDIGVYNPIWIGKLIEIKYLIGEVAGVGSDGVRVCKTLIHGDLTYRNILVGESGFLFYDFERGGDSYPEFDIYLFYIDRLTHLNRPSYEMLFNNILKFSRNEIMFQSMNTYDFLGGNFKMNSKVTKKLKYIFFYRMVVLSIGNFEENDVEAVRILNFVIKELEEEIDRRTN